MNARILFGLMPIAIMALFLVGTILRAARIKKPWWNEDVFGIISVIIAYALITFGPHGLLIPDGFALGFLMFFGLPFIAGVYLIMGFLFKLFQKDPLIIKIFAVALSIFLFVGFYNLWWLM